MKEALLKFLLLDFDKLKGTRTLTGLLLYIGPEVIDHLAGSAFCQTHTQACFALHSIATWFLAMGIRGK